MQKTKSNTKKTFVYQFETHFLIESATDNPEFYFSDKDYLAKSNIFFSKLDKDYVEVIYLNSQPSIVPSLYFEENMKSKYLDTNTVVSKSIVTDTSSDRKIKVVYSISDELTELLVKNNLEYSNNNYFTYLYNFLVNKISKSDGFSFYINLNYKSFDIIIFNNNEFIFFNSFKINDENEFLYYLFFVLKNYESSNKSDKIIFLGKFEKFKDYYDIASKYSIIDFVDLTNNSSIINDSPFFSIVNENYIRN
ncbi:MAG: DUF3822 family protein [Candidatus Marisimplicoccus sp.]